MFQFIIGIGQYEYRSDDGTTWTRTLREVPWRYAPIVHGNVDLATLPSRPTLAVWDFVNVLPSGFGMAVGHDVLDFEKRRAFVYVTDDGLEWYQSHLTLSGRVPPSWPVDYFESLALDARFAVLAWQDPLEFDYIRSHVIYSDDRGESWAYSPLLGESLSYLGMAGDGRFLALNIGFFLETRDLVSWGETSFDVDRPSNIEGKLTPLLRHVIFVSENVGYALIVHWPARYIYEALPSIGLVTTDDGGLSWRHLHVFAGPNFGDTNERHVLDLRIRDMRISRSDDRITS